MMCSQKHEECHHLPLLLSSIPKRNQLLCGQFTPVWKLGGRKGRQNIKGK